MPASQAALADNEPPPFLGTWQRVYYAVLIYLALMITALYFISGLFSY